MFSSCRSYLVPDLPANLLVESFFSMLHGRMQVHSGMVHVVWDIFPLQALVYPDLLLRLRSDGALLTVGHPTLRPNSISPSRLRPQAADAQRPITYTQPTGKETSLHQRHSLLSPPAGRQTRQDPPIPRRCGRTQEPHRHPPRLPPPLPIHLSHPPPPPQHSLLLPLHRAAPRPNNELRPFHAQ